MDVTPAEAISSYSRRLAVLDDDDMLSALKELGSLPDADDDDPAWTDDATLARAYQLMAFADEIGRRGLVAGISELYERAALGDAFEMMDGLRHGAEAAVNGDWASLTEIMRDAARGARSGTRRWAVRELGILRDPAGIAELLDARRDEEVLVRHEALSSLRMLAQVPDPSLRAVVAASLLEAARTDASQDLRYTAADLLAELDPAAAKPFRRPQQPESYADPDWTGDTSGREGAEATRRIVRALITGALNHPSIDAYLSATGRELVMTPGDGVYPPREPDSTAGGPSPDWRAKIVLWTAAEKNGAREASPLIAHIQLCRASRDEVRARLVDVASRDIPRR